MALQFTNTGVATGQPVEASQVSQSFDAFTAAKAYDITISGSLEATGSFSNSGSVLVSGSIEATRGFTGSLEGDSTTALTASFITASNVAGPEGFNSVITSSFSLSSSLAARATTASFVTTAQTASFFNIEFSSLDQGILTASIAGVDSFIDLGVDPDDNVRFTNVTASVGVKTIGLNAEGNTELGNSTTDTTKIIGTLSNTGSLNLTSSVLNGGLTTIDSKGAISCSDASSNVLTLEGNDIKFNNTSKAYIANINTGNSAKLQLGIGGTANSNANIILSGSQQTIITGSLQTDGNRVKSFESITLGNSDATASPTNQVPTDKDVLIITNNVSSVPSGGEYHLNLSDFVANARNGQFVEIIIIEGTGTGDVVVGDPEDMTGNSCTINGVSNRGAVGMTMKGDSSLTNAYNVANTIIMKTASETLVMYSAGASFT